MENKKITISLTTIIIIAVIIGALILGGISFIIYNNINKDNNYNLSQHQDTQENVNNTNSTEQTSSNDFLNNQSSIDNSNSSSISNNSSTQQNSSTSQTTSVNGETSSKSSPLPIGNWGIASKYSSGNYVDVPVKVVNVTRGNSAAQMVKNYCNNSSSIYKYEDAKEGMEWAVIDYSVDLTNVEGYSMGKDIRVDSKITGTGDNTSIHYKDNVYIVSTMNMTSGYSKENMANGQFAVQLPIGCTDYLIALGSSSHTQAFFTGE